MTKNNNYNMASAIDEAKKLYGTLKQGAGDFLRNNPTPVGYVAKKLTQPAQNTFSYLGKAANFVKQNPTPAVYANQQFQQKVAQPLVQNVVKPYIQNQVVQPIKQAVPSAVQSIPPLQLYRQATKTFNPSVPDLMGGAGGIVGATPMGAAYNVAQGVTTGVAQNLRTKAPLAESVRQAVIKPTSFAQTGLGVQNPILAGVIDIAGPSGVSKASKGIKSLKEVKTIEGLIKEAKALGIEGISPNAFKMDNPTNNEAISLVKTFREQGTLSTQQWKDLDRIFERFISKKAVKELSVAKKIQTLDYITNKNLGFNTFKPPKMGIVEDVTENPKGVLDSPQQTTKLTTQEEQIPGKLPSKFPAPEMPAQTGQNFSPVNQSGVAQKTSTGSISQKVENPADPYFNVNKLNVSPETKQVVKTTVENARPEIEKIVGKTLTNKEVVDTANATARVLNTTVSREQTLAWEASMLKARQSLSAMAENGTLTKDELDGMLAIKTQGEDIARKLQSLSIEADPQTVTAKQVIMEAILKVTKNADEILKASNGVDFNDPKQATEFYRKFVKPTTGEWLDTLRYNSMLSSPNTWINNISGNYQGTGIVAPIEKTITGTIDFLASKVTGKKQNYLIGEGPAYAAGYYSSLGTATKRMWKALKGETFTSIPDTRDMPLATGKVGKVVETALKPPQRILEGWDQFFSALTEGGIKKASEYRVSQGFDATTGKQLVKETEKRLFRAKLGDKGEGALLQAIDVIPNLIQNAKNSNKPIVSLIAKLTFPFIRTPVNVFKQGIEYSPAGLLTIPGAKEKLPQFTKALMGATVALGAAQLATSGRLTFGKPQSKEQQQLWDKAGMQPYAVKIGNNWVSYSKLHPIIGFNFAAVAAVNDALQKGKVSDEQSDTILHGISNILMFYADQSYMKSVGDMVNAASQGVSGLPKMASNYWQQYVPYRAFMGWMARLTDDYEREVGDDTSKIEKQMQYFMMQIPGLREKLPTKTGMTGEPQKQNNNVINAFSPARVTEGNQKYEDAFRIKAGEAKLKDAKNEAIKSFLGGDKDRAKELKQQYNLEVKKEDLKQYQTTQKKKALDAYVKGNIEEANRIKKETGVYITKNEVTGAAKREAIKLYKLGLKDEAKKLKEKYGFQVTAKDLE